MRDVDINYLRHRPSLRLWHITTRTQTIMENGVRVFSWPHHVRVTQTYSAITFATMRMGNCIRRSLASDESYHPYRDTRRRYVYMYIQKSVVNVFVYVFMCATAYNSELAIIYGSLSSQRTAQLSSKPNETIIEMKPLGSITLWAFGASSIYVYRLDMKRSFWVDISSQETHREMFCV